MYEEKEGEEEGGERGREGERERRRGGGGGRERGRRREGKGAQVFLPYSTGSYLLNQPTLTAPALVMANYRIVPSKHPWVLGIHGTKTGVGTYTVLPFVRITHIHVHANYRIIKTNGEWVLTWESTIMTGHY